MRRGESLWRFRANETGAVSSTHLDVYKRQLLYSTLLGAAVNIGLLYATIQIWGVYAVPIALTLGYLANVLMRILSIQKTVKVSFDLKRLALDIVVMAAACGIVYCGCSAVWKVLYGLCLLYTSRCV